MKQKIKFLLVWICLFGQLSAQRAVLIAPVVDLFSEQWSVYGADGLRHYYQKAPLSGDTSKFDCMRVGQGLFNQIVEIVQEQSDTVEVQVECSDILVRNRSGWIATAKFWTLMDNLIPSYTLQFDSDIFPQPIIWDQIESLHDSNVITLTMPWYDSKTHQTYSVGTRFVRAQKSKNGYYSVRFFDCKKEKKIERFIPKSRALCGDKNISEHNRRSTMVALLKKWAEGKKIVPYVWGGSSFTQKIKERRFKLKSEKFFDKSVNFWVRKKMKHFPITGFDCSGLVYRAAQICGIPYFFKTTTTFFEHGRALQDFTELQVADLIVWKGHVLIISDLENNRLISATGYGSGYGKLLEQNISECIAGIETYKELFDLYKQNLPINILNSDGVVVGFPKEFKIISLVS